MFWALPKATGDKRAVHRAWYCLMWIWPCDSPGSVRLVQKEMLCLLILGCPPRWCCWLFPFFRNSVTEESGSIEGSTNKTRNFSVMLDHTCRILWSIKAWSKTVTITHSSIWFWFSFPTVGVPCCRNELILFFSLCLPWELLSTAEGGGFGKHSSVTYLYDQIELWTRRGKSKGSDRNSKTC